MSNGKKKDNGNDKYKGGKKIGTRKQRRAMKKSINRFYGKKGKKKGYAPEHGMAKYGETGKRGYAPSGKKPDYKKASPVGKTGRMINRKARKGKSHTGKRSSVFGL